MYLGYDKNGNIVRYGHGEEISLGATQSEKATQLSSEPDQVKSTNNRNNLILIGVMAFIYFVFIKEKTPEIKSRRYTRSDEGLTPRESAKLGGITEDERDYVEGRKPLPERLTNTDKYPVTASLSAERVQELRNLRQRLRYGKGDREV